MKRIQSSRHGRFSAWLGTFTGFLVASTLACAQVGPGGFGAYGAAGSTGGGGRGGSVATAGGQASSGSGGRAAVSTAGVGQGSFRGAPTSGYAGMGNRAFVPQSAGVYNPSAQNMGGVGAYRSVPATPQQIARVNNLWTEQANTAARARATFPAAGLTAAQRNGSAYYQANPRAVGAGTLPFAQSSANAQAANGTRLYPGSYGYNSRGYNTVRSIPGNANTGRNEGDHSHHIYRRYPYPYYVYPYYPFGGDYGGYYAGDAGLNYGDANIAGPYASATLSPEPSTYDGGNPPPNQDNTGNPSAVVPPGAAQVPAPSSGWTEIPADGAQPPRKAASLGPDSLVEAVQQELANRGYFKGKVDAMYRDDTKDAIRRFQTDNQLVVTGLLNNATLTMLGLN